MQHFDGMRGTHLCLVDSVDPAVRSSPSASKTSKSGSGGSGVGFENAERVLVEDPLWRRLLFGEGEGLASGDEEWVKVTGTNGRGKVTPQGPAGEGEDSMVDGFGAAKVRVDGWDTGTGTRGCVNQRFMEVCRGGGRGSS